MLRPVAGVALSIGLVMAVVGAAMPSTLPAGATLFSGADSGAATNKAEPTQNAAPPEVAPAPETLGAAPGAASTQLPGYAAEASPLDTAGDGPVSALAQSSPVPQTREIDHAYVEPSPDADVTPVQGDEFAAARPADTTRDLLFYAGLAIAGLSVLLLALAWFARRYFADPLLR